MFWLSFADGSLPKGEQFLGALVVKADDFMLAHMRASMLGLNPGGEMVGFPIPEEMHSAMTPYVERLLQREEAQEASDTMDRIYDQLQGGK